MEENACRGGSGLDTAILFRDKIELRACVEEERKTGLCSGSVVGSSGGASLAATLAPRAR